jgi:hypothetical protein
MKKAATFATATVVKTAVRRAPYVVCPELNFTYLHRLIILIL